jgi:hypothetical protein
MSSSPFYLFVLSNFLTIYSSHWTIHRNDDRCIKWKHAKKKSGSAQFRLKAAHVLWATAKCRHPGSRERQMFFRREALVASTEEGYLTASGWTLEIDNKEKRKWRK